MMEKDKNKIDELFKEGLSDTNFDFDESHWQDIESRLDNERRSKRRKIVVLMTWAATLAAVLTVFFIWNSALFKSNNSQSEINEAGISPKKEVREIKTVQPKENSLDEAKGDQSWIAFQPIKRTDRALHISNETIVLQDIRLGKITNAYPIGMQERKLHTTFTIPRMDYNNQRLPHFNLREEPVEGLGERLAAIYQPKEGIGSEGQERERSVVSFLAGPDLTSVRGAGKSSLSENIGLAYSYPLTRGLSVSVGATYAKKNYKSAYKFYAPSNPPEMTQLPSNVSAVCDVIDVPLTASYTVLKSKKVKFNVSAGLSSYFMLKEKYTFDYENGGSYGGSQKSAVYEVNGENQHIFGVADFSISIEKKINDKINIGVKPFVKMPLTGIGYGNVDLESKGVAFTLGMSL
ncbi:outer membrane beta-barrel protein [Sphingobacterium sp.]|uniref:outer membrane beta-barrel protein n=1 Tax=Sphingobacterium sp. TaxID=341027 RepID=UPI00258B814E|nr:outer membrane beta-barrel protein [Sphingobacterium sp.]WET69827.1 MAG: outer membrane beta-barrel protein [Sphingobacterium sp.]